MFIFLYMFAEWQRASTTESTFLSSFQMTKNGSHVCLSLLESRYGGIHVCVCV